MGRLAPLAIPQTSAPETRLPCPRCAAWLVEANTRDAVLSTCRHCGGAWLDAATVERLKRARDADIDAAAARVAARGTEGAPPDRALSIACPVCRERLRREAIPGTSKTVDVCSAHGTWFDGADADELRSFIAAFEALRADGAPDDDRPAGLERGFLSRLFGR